MFPVHPTAGPATHFLHFIHFSWPEDMAPLQRIFISFIAIYSVLLSVSAAPVQVRQQPLDLLFLSVFQLHIQPRHGDVTGLEKVQLASRSDLRTPLMVLGPIRSICTSCLTASSHQQI